MDVARWTRAVPTERAARASVSPSVSTSAVARRVGRVGRGRRGAVVARVESNEGGDRESKPRFASEEERRRAIERLSPPPSSSSSSSSSRAAASNARRLGSTNAFGSSDAASRDERADAARRASKEKRARTKEMEAREMMRAMRAAIEREPEIEGMKDFVTASTNAQAKTASAMFERLTREEGYGVVESVFAVMSWMSDAIDEAADAADAEIQERLRERAQSRDDASQSAPFDDQNASSRGPNAKRDENEPGGVFGALSNALREWFAIDISEMEDGRKQVVVNASAEFLAVFVILLVVSSHFGGELVSNALSPDPLLR